MNSFFSWVGGKHLLKKEIIKKFPPYFNKYVEVFGGAAWVLFHKDPSSYEVYNDCDCIRNLYKDFKIETLSRKQPLSPNKIKETYRELLISNY